MAHTSEPIPPDDPQNQCHEGQKSLYKQSLLTLTADRSEEIINGVVEEMGEEPSNGCLMVRSVLGVTIYFIVTLPYVSELILMLYHNYVHKAIGMSFENYCYIYYRFWMNWSSRLDREYFKALKQKKNMPYLNLSWRIIYGCSFVTIIACLFAAIAIFAQKILLVNDQKMSLERVRAFLIYEDSKMVPLHLVVDPVTAKTTILGSKWDSKANILHLKMSVTSKNGAQYTTSKMQYKSIRSITTSNKMSPGSGVKKASPICFFIPAKWSFTDKGMRTIENGVFCLDGNSFELELVKRPYQLPVGSGYRDVISVVTLLYILRQILMIQSINARLCHSMLSSPNISYFEKDLCIEGVLLDKVYKSLRQNDGKTTAENFGTLIYFHQNVSAKYMKCRKDFRSALC